jgi:hypothetical protein
MWKGVVTRQHRVNGRALNGQCADIRDVTGHVKPAAPCLMLGPMDRGGRNVRPDDSIAQPCEAQCLSPDSNGGVENAGRHAAPLRRQECGALLLVA